ncbi:MAG: GGDEF domain-containing protein [Candidatus Eremiobacteraeota bacterium]|nr:GGDEF domain-containing protein [Candidatus Eremiobacteraeota bacterium]
MAILLVVSTFAIVTSLCAMSSWRAHARLRDRHEYIDSLHSREEFVLEAMRECMEASRVSSDAVIERLSEAIRRREPEIDAVLAFAPRGEELAAFYAQGPRVEHFQQLRLRRDMESFLPARAALAGHRATGSAGVIIPTDRYALAVPMQDRGGLHAVIYCSSTNSFGIAQEDTIVRTIEHAASPFALAVEREGDRADATFDGLTGLLTPRAFRERLRSDVARLHLRSSGVLSLWFIDTDHFKSVNDTYGHAAGDRVLQQMAALLRAHVVADVDIGARNGGDEFCAIVYDVQKTIAIERAQALCDAVRRADFSIPLQLTASIGVASLPFDAHDASELLEVADAAMYHSKRSGRDRVSFAVNGTGFSVYR